MNKPDSKERIAINTVAFVWTVFIIIAMLFFWPLVDYSAHYWMTR